MFKWEPPSFFLLRTSPLRKFLYSTNWFANRGFTYQTGHLTRQNEYRDQHITMLFVTTTRLYPILPSKRVVLILHSLDIGGENFIPKLLVHHTARPTTKRGSSTGPNTTHRRKAHIPIIEILALRIHAISRPFSTVESLSYNRGLSNSLSFQYRQTLSSTAIRDYPIFHLAGSSTIANLVRGYECGPFAHGTQQSAVRLRHIKPSIRTHRTWLFIQWHIFVRGNVLTKWRHLDLSGPSTKR